MDHAVYLTSVFGFDRNTVAVAAHRDDRILQIAAEGSVDQTVQRCVDFVVDPGYAPADMFECRACIVADLVFCDDTTFDLIAEQSQRFELVQLCVETVRKFILSVVPSVCFGASGILQDFADTKKFSASE